MESLYRDLPPVEIAGRKFVGRVLFGLLVLVSALVGATAGLLLVYTTDLPQVEALEAYRPSSITELYDDHDRVIGSFALQRRVVAGYDDFAPVLRDALVSIEDKDFYRHSGINFWRIVGAAYRDVESGGKIQGASTLTMQLARNLFLSPDRSFHRKVQEVMLAIQIERRFTKPQIFTLYANQIFLGHGVYGFEAASEYYFGKPARQLTLAEAALLAGLPKGPQIYSAINHPDRAIKRRNLVINAMLEDGKITAAQAADARSAPVALHLQHDPNSLAPYFVEEIRRYLENKYGADQVHEGGLKVYTSLDVDLQKSANLAVLDGLAAYERRHGWKGHLENVVAEGTAIDKYQHPDWDEEPEVNGYVHALVTSSGIGIATLKFGRYAAAIGQADVAWTQGKIQDLLKPGDICYLRILSLSANGAARVSLEQDSGAQGALVAIDNTTGGIKAMVGGRDFSESKFDRVTQALRQVGSSFKPYVYTTVIEKGELKSYLLNSYTARKLGMKTTGNAARGITGNSGVGHGNLFLEKGERSPDELVRGIRTGLYVTELIGSGVNIVTGDYSRGAAGQWIENGEFAYPVSEITIASTLHRMLMDLESVGSDLEFRGSVVSPTVVIREMTVSGQ